MNEQVHASSGQIESGTCGQIGTPLTQPRSADVLRFRVKVPQTLDQAAKLRNWLERQRHKTPRPAQNYLSNIVAQCKSIKDEHDLKRVQPMIAWQAERLDLARQQQREG